MPYVTRKVTKKSCYKVYNRKSKRIFSKCTTKENAKKQLKLLRAIQYNKNFKPRKTVKKR
jgi:hypothetical protein